MSWWRGLGAVASAFIGIRRRDAAREDARLRPWQIVLAALLLVLCLIVGLLVLVTLITQGNGG